MTEDTPPASPNPGQLMEEAAVWFARMRGPEAEAHRPQFDAWLARGALHRAAYNRAGEIFSLGKFLREEANPASGGSSGEEEEPGRAVPGGRRAARLLPISLLAACLLLLIGWAVFARPDGRISGAERDIAGRSPSGTVASYASGAGTRTERLEDGSIVVLEPDSVLSVSFSPQRRHLRLERGAARFAVAHENRPFVVAAGDGTVTARGTVFEVRLAEGDRVTVHLLRGSVDVTMPAPGRGTTPTRRLQPGQSISYAGRDNRQDQAGPGPAPTPLRPMASTMRAFDRIRLADVIAQANAASPVRIRLADPALGKRLVSGQFRINDPRKLAERLAWIFDLRALPDTHGNIVLSGR